MRCWRLKRHLQVAHDGQAVVESIFAILITVIMFLLVSALSVYMYMQTTIFMAARQGARLAAVNTSNGAVVSAVQGFFNQMTGQSLPGGNIVVSGPTGTVGQRNVSVQVTYDVQSPVPVGAFLAGLGGGASATDLDTFTCGATATMRFEE